MSRSSSWLRNPGSHPGKTGSNPVRDAMASPMDGTESTKLGKQVRSLPGLPLLLPMDGLAPPKREDRVRSPTGAPQGSNPTPATATTFGTSALSYGAARAFDSLRRDEVIPDRLSAGRPALTRESVVRIHGGEPSAIGLKAGRSVRDREIRLVRFQHRRPCGARSLVRASALQAEPAGFDPLAPYHARVAQRQRQLP
jgi:hypothetical protein